MSDVFRRVTIYKDGSVGFDDERGISIEGDEPRGFTRVDVETLRALSALSDKERSQWDALAKHLDVSLPPSLPPHEGPKWIDGLADRIEAFLPPGVK